MGFLMADDDSFPRRWYVPTRRAQSVHLLWWTHFIYKECHARRLISVLGLTIDCASSQPDIFPGWYVGKFRPGEFKPMGCWEYLDALIYCISAAKLAANLTGPETWVLNSTSKLKTCPTHVFHLCLQIQGVACTKWPWRDWLLFWTWTLP